MLRGEPRGEVACEVFDEDTSEAFHRAERCTVDHDRGVVAVVRADVAELEALRENVVNLDSAELPFATDDVFDHEVDFRAVEGGISGLFAEGDAEAFGGFATSRFGFVPVVWVANELRAVGITQTHANAVVFHPESFENDFDELEAAFDFVVELLGGAKNVGVVLSEATDTGHAVELAALFPAIDGAELSKAHGEISIAVRLAVEDLDVHRAIHRLEEKAFDVAGFHLIGQLRTGASLVSESLDLVAVDERRELRFLIVGEVTGGLVEAEFSDVGRKDLVVCLLYTSDAADE